MMAIAIILHESLTATHSECRQKRIKCRMLSYFLWLNSCFEEVAQH